MLQILNSQERNQAFLKFILFFLITVALIVIAIFFDFKMPTRENKILQDKLSAHRQQEYHQESFVLAMQEVDTLFKALDRPDAPAFNQVERQIKAKLATMTTLLGSTNTLYGKMNKTILENFDDRLNVKRKILEANQKLVELEARAKGYKERLDEAKEDIRDAIPR